MDNSTKKEKPPAQCKTCNDAINSIGGRYCKTLKKYVQYYSQPPCENGCKKLHVIITNNK